MVLSTPIKSILYVCVRAGTCTYTHVPTHATPMGPQAIHRPPWTLDTTKKRAIVNLSTILQRVPLCPIQMHPSAKGLAAIVPGK